LEISLEFFLKNSPINIKYIWGCLSPILTSENYKQKKEKKRKEKTKTSEPRW
jgi:hypothetical protein